MALLCLITSPGWADAAERGRYLLAAAGCVTCHTKPEGGEFLAGGRDFATPFGTFYSPNITPHPTQGIGRWTKREFIAALREGIGPDGHYFPAFPFTSYTRMTDEDVTELWGYLRSVEPSDRPNTPHRTGWYLNRFAAARIWNWLFFTPGRFQSDPSRSPEWNRGAYLVKALGHCGECHTPRTPWGSLQTEQELAGNPDGPEGDPVPNLTPDRETGLGRWSAADIIWYLETGGRPGGDFAGGLMAEVIDNSTSRLRAEDREAIARYLQSLPAVHNPAFETAE